MQYAAGSMTFGLHLFFAQTVEAGCSHERHHGALPLSLHDTASGYLAHSPPPVVSVVPLVRSQIPPGSSQSSWTIPLHSCA